MKVTIENYRGIRRADFTVGGITLIGAPNAAGKSSIAQAVAACITGRPLPIPGMTKSMSGFLVRSGSTKAFAEVANDNDESMTRIAWPKAEISTEGPNPPSASEWAAGIVSLADMNDKERSTALTDFLNARPTKPDLINELTKAKVSPEHAEKLWSMIEEFGWEESERKARERGKELKWQWQNTTGENYGSKKAETYLPSDWEFDLEEASEDALAADVANAKAELEAAIAASAVDFADTQRLQEQADQIEELGAKVAEASQRLKAAREAENAASDVLADNPMPKDNPPSVACPHCAGALIIQGGTLHTIDGQPTEQELATMRKAHNDARQALADARVLTQGTNTEHSDSVSKLNAAMDAKAQLDANNSSESQPQGDVDVDQAREKVASAEKRLTSFTKKRDADKAHSSIERNQVVVDVLSPGGLRLTVLYAAVRKFCDDYVKPLTKAAGWADVQIDRELTLNYGDRIYALLSESEKYRVRVTLQAAMAKVLGDNIMVIDAADILDRVGRNGLVKMLSSAGIDAVVCMTIPQRSDLPDLSKGGKGYSYWIDSGEIKES